jgi:hypothetical protein
MAEKHTGDVDRTGLKEEKIPAKLKGEGHEVAFDIDGVPEKLFVGDTANLVLFGACQSGCDLVGDAVSLQTIDGTEVSACTFETQEGELAVSAPMTVKMPEEPGEYEYIIHYEPRELPLPDDGGPAFKNPHEERDLLVVFTVQAHHVAVSTWGVTAPVWVGGPIEVSVGVSCSSGCSLAGQKIAIYNENDELMCSGTLHEPVAPRTTLWWDTLTATAPTEAKLHRWEARFVAEGLDAPHDDAKHKFSFVARVRPERDFRVTVIDEKTGKPQRSARVELKPADGTGKAQFASTGAEGTASIGVEKGTYALKITAPSRKSFTETVDLTEHDLEVEVHLQPTGAAAGDPIPMKVIAQGEKAEQGEGAVQVEAAPEQAPEVTPQVEAEPEAAEPEEQAAE